MPAPAALPRLVRSHSELCGRWAPRTAPPLSPPLRRSFSSTFTLIPEECSVSPDRSFSVPSLLWCALTWYPRTLLAAAAFVLDFALHPAWKQLLVVLPTLWISAWLFVFWKCVEWPLAVLKTVVTRVRGAGAPRRLRTVLLSGGSTVQALHLARNFHSAGARVVAVEVEGLFGLLKFSAAVDAFYAVPRPSPADPHPYVRALCDVAEREGASFFVPVSATTPAYYDALAKPHLELQGCACFSPGVRDALALDDPLEVLRRGRAAGLPVPDFTVLSSERDVSAWYSRSARDARGGRYWAASAGAAGARDRIKTAMPEKRADFKAERELGPDRPWVVVHEPRGERFLTCTTIKDSKVVANVTCRVDHESRGLVPCEESEVEAWIGKFLSRLEPSKPLTGHVSFRLVREAATGTLMPQGARVGVSLPYICHTSVHPRLLVRPCRHFDRKNSGPLVAAGGRYWMHEAVLSTLRHPGLEAVGKLIGTVLDRREALFAYWDPLPYCAYYHFQLPLRAIRGSAASQFL